jgi:hypothetical protein
MQIKKGYKRIKKNDVKKWLLGGNAKIYAIILVVFLAAVVLMFNTVKSMFTQDVNNTPVNNNEESSQTNAFIVDNLSYKLDVNKKKNFITVYKMNQDGQSSVYKVLRCSVNGDVKVTETSIAEKSMWRQVGENAYGHYASKLSESAVIHSAPYSAQDTQRLIVSAYNNLGNTATIGSIYLTASDSKWIYENCGVGTKVRIYEDENEQPAQSLGEFSTVAAGATGDPSDNNSNDGHVDTKINYMTGVKDCTIRVNQPFDKWTGVYAVDMNGKDLTSSIKITGTVNTAAVGTYTLIYHLSDSYGTDLAYYRYVTVTN